MSQNKKKVDRHDTSVSRIPLFPGVGGGVGGGGILIPYSRYYFTLIPHPALLYVLSLYRILCFVSKPETFVRKD